MIIDFENDKKGGGTSCELQEVAVTYTANGTSEIVPEAGYDGVSKATVTVEVPDPETEVLTATITENGAKSYTPTKYGYSKVNLTVDVPTPEPVLEELKATTNGSYTPQAPAVGYSKVDVNVPGGAGPAMVDFGSIGYDNNDVTVFNADLAYSLQKKNEYEAGTIRNFENDKQLVYAPKLNVGNKDIGNLFYGCSSMIYVPLLDTSKISKAKQLFASCESLTSIPLIDTSKITDFWNFFQFCENLESVPQLNTESAISINGMFNGCKSLTSIPILNTSKVQNMSGLFYGCTNLKEIPAFDCANATDMSSIYTDCSNLTTIPLVDCTSLKNNGGNFGLNYTQATTLTTLGGFKNLKISTNISGPSWKPLDKITKESILNVVNNLGQADPAFEAAPKLTLSPTQYGYLTEADIAGATAKGWSIVQG